MDSLLPEIPEGAYIPLLIHVGFEGVSSNVVVTRGEARGLVEIVSSVIVCTLYGRGFESTWSHTMILSLLLYRESLAAIH